MTIKDYYASAADNLSESLNAIVNDGAVARYPFDELNSITGGIKPSHLTIVGGEPGAAKTTFLVQVADHLARQGLTVIFLSLEMVEYKLIEKSLPRFSERQLTISDLPKCYFDAEKFEVLERAVAKYQTIAKKIYYICNPECSTDDLENIVTSFFQGCKEQLVILIDYIQIMPSAQKPYSLDERLQIKANIAALHQCATTHHIPIIAVSSVSRESYAKEKAALKCLSGAQQIEYCADTVLFLSTAGNAREREMNSLLVERPVILSVLKNRYGRKGDVALTFNANYAEFTARKIR